MGPALSVAAIAGVAAVALTKKREAPQRVQEACAVIHHRGVLAARIAGYSAEEIAHANRILALG